MFDFFFHEGERLSIIYPDTTVARRSSIQSCQAAGHLAPKPPSRTRTITALGNRSSSACLLRAVLKRGDEQALRVSSAPLHYFYCW